MSPPVKNIYYMLSYAFYSLNFKEYKKVASEEFENIYELFSELLIIALNKQIKQGLYRDYIEVDETTSSIRGKINITESINELSFINKKLNCTYDEFSINTDLNKIIKTTLTILLKEDITKIQRHSIKNILLYFRDVSILDTNNINWQIRYDRNNQDYRMIIGICYLTLKGLLQSDSKGNRKLMKFFDDQRMSRLYEKFILNYYRKEYDDIKAYSPQIEWQLDDDFGEMLPRMQTDITLEYDDRILIIDAKYYSKSTQSHYDTKTIHSHNLYQIFTYVKNKEAELELGRVKSKSDRKVSGMLLYARSKEDLNHDYSMSGNRISVKTLDLNLDFENIRKQLDSIVDDYLKA